MQVRQDAQTIILLIHLCPGPRCAALVHKSFHKSYKLITACAMPSQADLENPRRKQQRQTGEPFLKPRWDAQEAPVEHCQRKLTHSIVVFTSELCQRRGASLVPAVQAWSSCS